jgi:hypothetical protein
MILVTQSVAAAWRGAAQPVAGRATPKNTNFQITSMITG